VGKAVSVADVVSACTGSSTTTTPPWRSSPSPPGGRPVAPALQHGRTTRDLNNLVDEPYQKANLIIQLRSWDAVETRALLAGPPRPGGPAAPGADVKPAGIAYFNMVWNDGARGDAGRVHRLLRPGLLLLILDYGPCGGGRQLPPLLFTVVLIYGAVGLREDFDMPISVLSTLSLGLAIDFAIHFVGRFQRYRETGDLTGSLVWTAARPGRGIVRNAVLFASGFGVMLFAALTPYITVGAFMIAIMVLSAFATVVLLPALIALFPRWLTSRLETARP
jgi:hypothetical protein